MEPQRLFRSVFFLLSVLAAAPALVGQPAYRLKDINTVGNTTWPLNLTSSGGRLYFIGDDGAHGPELWTSDGSGAGTARVPGTSGATRIMKAGGRVFFMRGFDLWVSDGTSAGTLLVTTLVDAPSEWVDVSGELFFSLWSPARNELWKSDGTAAGTLRVKEPDPGTGPLNVQSIVPDNGRLYFYAALGSIDTLWTSDGNPAGTRSVGTVQVNESLTVPPLLAIFGSSILFSALDPELGYELWISDGTENGTTLFGDLDPGIPSSAPQEFVLAGSRVFFTAHLADVGWRLWSTDGTQAGTTMVDSLAPNVDGGAGYPVLRELTNVAGRVCLRTIGDAGLWVSDGTDAGTVLLRIGDSANLTAVGSHLFFTVGSQLWTSDLTPSGTHVVMPFATAFTIIGASFAELEGQLYFAAADDAHGPQLWKSDGTSAGTTLVRAIHPGLTSSNPTQFREAAGNLFFLAETENAGGYSLQTRLWKSDGTEARTVAVSDVSGDFSVSVGSRLFFPGPGLGQAIWETDGSPAGTVRLAGQPDALMIQDRALVASGARAFWVAQLGNEDPGLWVSDQRVPATAQQLRSFSRVSDVVDAPEGVLFGAGGSDPLFDLWKSDGTLPGTHVVHAFASSQPILILRAGSRDFILTSARTLDPLDSRQLWVTDGTDVGTTLVWDFGPQLVPVGLFCGSFRGLALLQASNQAGDLELWRSDGTAAGTFVLHTFAGPFSTLGEVNKTFDGGFFAFSPDRTRFQQLWVTDGSVAGTRLVRDFSDVAGSYLPPIGKLLDVTGTLVFGLRADAGEQLWRSDGTKQGTSLFQAGVSAEIPYGYVPGRPGLAVGGTFFFAGDDRFAGTELWVMPLSAAWTPRATSLSLLSPCRALDTRQATGFLGGPALVATVPRVFPVGGVCGIPSTARALAANVTVTGATADGLLKIHPSDIGEPETSVINFKAGQTRANNATITLGPDAEFTVRYQTSTGTGAVHVILDVIGWYE